MLQVCIIRLISRFSISDPCLSGTYDFSTINLDKYTGGISYFNAITSRGFWGLTGYAVGGGGFQSSTIDAMYVFICVHPSQSITYIITCRFSRDIRRYLLGM